MPRREIRTTDGKCISYLIEGRGPALVMLASALESADGWAELGYVDAFADRFTVVAVDLVGQGASDRSTDPADYSWERVVEQVTAVCDAERLDRCVLWGYANGAETALALARRRPEHVRALVLGGIYLGEARTLWSDQGIDHDATIHTMAAALDRGDWDTYFDLFPIDWGDRSRARARSRNDAAVAAASTRGDLTRPRGLVSPGVPTLAYWGCDVFYGSANSDLALGLPVETLVVPGGQGDAFLDSDPVIPGVRKWLERAVS